MKQHSISIVYPYFGQWPEWFDLFFETLKRNSSINFIFYTDCDYEKFDAPNVRFITITFNEYVAQAADILNTNLHYKKTYKLCDLKPFYGLIHFEDFKKSDFFGYGDIDVLLGDVRSFYNEKLLSQFDVLSTHENIIGGHLCLFRNNNTNRNIGTYLGGWKEKIQVDEHVGIDEMLLSAYDKWLKQNNGIMSRMHKIFFKPAIYLKEQYTTPFTPIPWLDGTLNDQQPDTWYYKDGKITNSRDQDREFLYLHFMNFKSSKYRHDGTQAPWEGESKISFAQPEDMKKGIVINRKGIFPIHHD